jgi:16S rRNA processing protein RimM
MIVLGRVTAPFGVRGWIKVHPYGDDPQSWAAIPQWWIGREPEDWRELRLEELRPHGSGVIAKLEGVTDRSLAQALAGLDFAAPREALPATASDEYYWGDLIGLRVEGSEKRPLGRVERLIESGAGQVLGVRDGERERLIPFVAPVVAEVDLAAGVIRVDWRADW